MSAKSWMGLLGALLLSVSAHAHTHLKQAVPANGSVLAEAPTHIALQFSEAVRVTALTMQKENEAKQKLGPLPEQTAVSVSVPVSDLGPGIYVVSYRVLGADGHMMGGEVRFTVTSAPKKG